jgi:hypothetical protein
MVLNQNCFCNVVIEKFLNIFGEKYLGTFSNHIVEINGNAENAKKCRKVFMRQM